MKPERGEVKQGAAEQSHGERSARPTPRRASCKRHNRGPCGQLFPVGFELSTLAPVGKRHSRQREQAEAAEHDERDEIAIGDDMSEGPEREAPQDRMPGHGDDSRSIGVEGSATEGN